MNNTKELTATQAPSLDVFARAISCATVKGEQRPVFNNTQNA